jgi:hypothetical protein
LASTKKGVGKTAILCELTHLIPTWLSKEKMVIVTRFIGRTYCTRYAHELWRNIGVQLSMAIGVDDRPPAITAVDVAKWLASLFDEAAALSITIVLLLDDVHTLQYARNYGAVLPTSTPTNVIVITTGAADYNTAGTLMPANTNTTVQLMLPDLSERNLIEISTSELSKRKRTVTTEQKEYLNMIANSLGRPNAGVVHLMHMYAGTVSAIVMAARQLTTISSFDALPKVTKTGLSLENMFDVWIASVANDTRFVQLVLLYLSLSDCGLTGMCTCGTCRACAQNVNCYPHCPRPAQASVLTSALSPARVRITGLCCDRHWKSVSTHADASCSQYRGCLASDDHRPATGVVYATESAACAHS